MSSIAQQTKEICRLYDIRPARSKGQNFLINEGIYEAIIKAASVSKKDTVLEVGPGLGFLTAKLADRSNRVVAVELDDKLATLLKVAIDAKQVNNVEIINQDILSFNPYKHFQADENYRVVANLPYNITSIFLRSFLSSPRPPQSFVLMLQKEVAERIISQEPKMSLLSLSVAYYGEAQIIKIVPASDFWPAPSVDSAIVKIIYTKKHINIEEDKFFFRVARIGFSSKRKMLKNNLISGLKIEEDKISKSFEKLNIDSKARAENLSLQDWHNLVAAISNFML